LQIYWHIAANFDSGIMIDEPQYLRGGFEGQRLLESSRFHLPLLACVLPQARTAGISGFRRECGHAIALQKHFAEQEPYQSNAARRRVAGVSDR
jgi:hypothetical protein